MLKKLAILILLILAVLVRLFKINSPIADWHSWRQADTAAVARNFLKNDFNLLYPKFDDLSSIPSGIDNPNGYRFVEFPIYNAIHAFFYKATSSISDFLSFEGAGRLTSSILWVIAGLFLYRIVKKSTNWITAIFSLFFFLFLPYNIFYSRTILPDPAMVFFTLASIYYLLSWEGKKGKVVSLKLVLSLFLAMGAVLTKPYAVFILVPSWTVIFFKSKKYFVGIFFAFLVAVPFGLWRLWIQQFPEGIPANSWLYNAGNMRLRPAWWRWLFYERLAKLILGGWGTGLFAAGIVSKIKNKNIIFWSWLAGSFGYLVIFARGNIQHDYYQIILAPTVAVFLGLGVTFLLSIPKEKVNKWFLYPGIGAIILFSILFSGYQVIDYYQINHPEIIEAGMKADQLLPLDAKVIAPYNGDTALLYQTNRRGWPIMIYSYENILKLGATHYVSVNFDDDTNKLAESCQVLDKTDRWIIINLLNCTKK